MIFLLSFYLLFFIVKCNSYWLVFYCKNTNFLLSITFIVKYYFPIEHFIANYLLLPIFAFCLSGLNVIFSFGLDCDCKDIKFGVRFILLLLLNIFLYHSFYHLRVFFKRNIYSCVISVFHEVAIHCGDVTISLYIYGDDYWYITIITPPKPQVTISGDPASFNYAFWYTFYNHIILLIYFCNILWGEGYSTRW